MAQPLMQGRPVDLRGTLLISPGTTEVDAMAYTTTEDYTIPAGTTRVIITCNADSWIRFATGAAIPGAEVTDGSASIFMLKGRERVFEVNPAGKIAFVSVTGAAVASIERFGA